MIRFPNVLWLGVAAVLLAACTVNSAQITGSDGPRNERILIWHTWADEDAIILNQMLEAYQELYPNIKVISVAVPASAIAARYVDRTSAGFGPDMILASASVVYELAEHGLIRDLAPLELDLSSFLSSAVQMVSDGTHLYALPLSGHTHVLYYDKERVETPPETIAELLQRVKEGEVLAQNPDFAESYWGIGAYDGRVADSQQRLLFGEGGFTNWLDFLTTARALPGFILDDRSQDLQQTFIDGQATYYIADSDQLPTLVAAMGPEKVGVALLPTGPNGGSPRPFLELDALAFSKASSAREFDQALDLAQYLTGAQNQLFLATADLGRVPLNTQIRLDPSLPENTLTVARQSRSSEAISFVNRGIWRDLEAGALGFFDNYRQVVQGVLSPSDMVEQGLQSFAEEYGVHPPTTKAEDFCPEQPGALTIWHALLPEQARIFEELAVEFEDTCPGVTLTLDYVPPEEVYARFATEAGDGNGPDVLYESSRWLARLAEEGLLLNLTERVTPHFLQRFMPEAVQTMRYGGSLYGIPEAVDPLALFYNPTLISDPPNDLHQMMLNVDVDRRAALPMGFFWGYWGLDPFGGFDFDSYTGQILETEGLVVWLQMLQEFDAQPGVDLYFAPSAAVDAFASGEAAYLVSGPWSLARLRKELGEDRFRVVPLPNGPFQPGSPMLQVRGVMINANASDLSADTAIAFGQFLSSPSSQQRLLESGSHVTSNVTVDLAEYPNLASFREQAKVADLVVETSKFLVLEELGDELYRTVLLDGADPEEAVSAFVEAVHAATGAQ